MSLGAQNRAKSRPRAVDFDVKSCKSTDLREKKAVFLAKHDDVSGRSPSLERWMLSAGPVRTLAHTL